VNRQGNAVLIGGFVVGAVALAVLAVLLFMRGNFTTTARHMIYFSGSVNGLNVGAPVKVKGVAVGSVRDIWVIYDEPHGQVLTPVIVEFTRRKFYEAGGNLLGDVSPKELTALIEQGLRAQLQVQSLVTGQLYVDINFRPDTKIRLVGGDSPPYSEIPSIPSSKEQIESTIDDVIAMVRKMPLEETFKAALNSIVTIEKLLKSPEIASSLTSLDRTLKEFHSFIHHLDSRVDPLSGELQRSLAESTRLLQNVNRQGEPLLTSVREAAETASGAFAQAQKTLETVDETAGRGATLNLALRNLASAANSLKVLADYLERHPDALLYGKGGKGAP
jgi:paraquat-inducible protein B